MNTTGVRPLAFALSIWRSSSSVMVVVGVGAVPGALLMPVSFAW
jgi:hypothetical protein